MSATGKDPQWREAERFAERHARTVLARPGVDVARTPPGVPSAIDLLGPGFVAAVAHGRSPVERVDVERLHRDAGTRVAAYYSRAGYAKTAALWADEHHVALFAYTDTGYAAPVNQYARELVARAQADSEQQVRAAVEQVSRRALAHRREAERVEREAHAAVLRAQQEARLAADRRRVEQARRERVLGRTVALLLAWRLDPAAVRLAADRLAQSGTLAALEDDVPRLSPAARRTTLAAAAALFDDAAAILEVLTDPADRDGPAAEASRRTVARGLDALEAASGTGHVAPDELATWLRRAARCWRSVVADVERGLAAAVLPTPRPAPDLARPAPHG